MKHDKHIVLLAKAKLAAAEEEAYPFLPEILTLLERMIGSREAPLDTRIRMARAIGRLITDSYEFSESDLGGELLSFVDEFASN